MSPITALAVCGPTASGKSEIASLLAAEIGAEIVNADSRQVYAGMPIGTGWPSEQARARAQHHLYGFVDPGERYSAARFVSDASAACERIARSGKMPILVGGTGLYIEALSGTMPLDRAVADDELRARVRMEAAVHPHETLRAWLAAIDPEASARVRPRDAYRTLRALESALARRSDSRSHGALAPCVPVALKVVVLEVDREVLRRRIVTRVRDMFQKGLAQEAQAIAARWPDSPALSGLGYAEALAWQQGLATYEEAVRATIRRTGQYAKRQQTWFRRMSDALRIEADDPIAALSALRAAARENATST
ncbi:MAG TPA: tRNA (adenosine(37)-N6)-dimethylallyltransferase MiaA [Candidatus Tumulicola sp.]|nr:tRNA (adenosine(37)-N6)-dimethylallyltransferase MiaA [Candidatus Tumulicola sp.]